MNFESKQNPENPLYFKGDPEKLKSRLDAQKQNLFGEGKTAQEAENPIKFEDKKKENLEKLHKGHGDIPEKRKKKLYEGEMEALSEEDKAEYMKKIFEGKRKRE